MTGRHRPDPKGRAGTPTTSAAAHIDARHARPIPERVAGRRAPPRPKPGRGSRRRILFASLGALAVAATALVAVTTWPRDSGRAKASGDCIGAETLRVIAAPAIAPSIKSIVARWEATHPAVNGICVPVIVTAMDSMQAEQSLITQTSATVWIPDSTVWSSRLATDAPSLTGQLVVGHSVATSPLVVAVAPPRAAAVTADAKKGLAAALSGKTPAELPSPTSTTEGALALLGLQAQLGKSAAAQNSMGSLFLHLAQRVLPNAAAGFADLKEFPTTAPAFVASEQAVLQANKGAPKPVATAVYPNGANAALDFPIVQINPSRVRIFAEALQAFTRQLTSPAGVRTFNAAGIRNGAAAPLQGSFAAAGGGVARVTLTPPTNPPTVTSVLQHWVAAGEPNQFLAVIDVSGSMGDDSGNGRSKIEVASEAGVGAVALMPGSWSFGLWSFSEKPAPAHDWTQLVPLGTVTSNRAAILSAVRGLPSHVGGNTGLYSTALAAFRAVTAHYAANKVNSVLLMTDGANVDPTNNSLSTLISTLKGSYNPHRPVHITTIAFGKDADVGALKKISAATGGHSYIARKPQDINTIFAEVALQSA
jgi:Ca-activated chloride channel homolog